MRSLLEHPWALFLVLWVVLSGTSALGYHLGVLARADRDPERHDQSGHLRDSLLVLVSLLLGFTLAAAVPRFERRRELVVEEANAIGTTYLRSRTLPQPQQGRIQELLRAYVDARIEFFAAGLDQKRLTAAVTLAKQLQAELWDELTSVAREDRSPVLVAFMQSLNDVIDLSTERSAALENRIPVVIWVMVLSISVLTMLVSGMSMRKRFWLSEVTVPLMIAIVVALIAELDTSRSGVIRVSQTVMYQLKEDLQH